MAHVRLNLARLSAPELIDLATHLESGLEGNPHFSQPDPSLEELRQLAAKLMEQQAAYRQQRLRLNELKVARDATMAALSDAIVHEAIYVQEASGGDLEKIMSANFHAEPDVHLWPFANLSEVHDLSANAGDTHGEIDLSWDPVRGASGYEVEISTDLGGWRALGAVHGHDRPPVQPSASSKTRRDTGFGSARSTIGGTANGAIR